MGASAPARWRSSFLTLPDGPFFDVLRNYLGDFPTPFNKHQLMDALEVFLRRPETRRRMIGLVDHRDARIITAVSLLNAPGAEDLAIFFQGEPEERTLPLALLNLRDRLLIYLDRGSGKETFLPNPHLWDDLSRDVVDPGLLFPSLPASPESLPPLPPVGGLPEDFRSSRLPRLSQALAALGLMPRSGGKPDPEAWKEFAGFPEIARLCLLVRCGRQEDLWTAWKEAERLAAFLPALGSGRAYTRKTLILLGRLAAQGLMERPFLTEEMLGDLQDFRMLLPCGAEGLVPNPRLWGEGENPLPGGQSPPPALANPAPVPPPLFPGGVFFPRPFSPPRIDLPPPGTESRAGRTPDPRAIREMLLRRLSAADLPEDQAGEIRERIRRGLVISPEQIRPDPARRERAEARGLDYNGKVLVIRQALEDGFDGLEILLHSADGVPSRFLVRPRELRRDGVDLVLTAEREPHGESLEIPVQKISLVRRLRSFLIR